MQWHTREANCYERRGAKIIAQVNEMTNCSFYHRKNGRCYKGSAAFIFLEACLIQMAVQYLSTDLISALIAVEKGTDVPEFLIRAAFPESAASYLIFLFICLAISLRPGYHEHWSDRGTAVFIALGLMIGRGIQVYGAFFETFAMKRVILLYALCFPGFYFAVKLCVLWLRAAWHRIHDYFYLRTGWGESFARLSERRLFLYIWGILIVCWLPYALIRYPAGFEWDGQHQIDQFLTHTMTDHWPPASSAYMGGITSLGYHLFGTYDAGVFLYVLVQLFTGSAVFAFAAVTMRQLSVDLLWVRLSVLLYALVPVYPGINTSVIKDSAFSCAVLLFTVLLSRYFFLEPSLKNSSEKPSASSAAAITCSDDSVQSSHAKLVETAGIAATAFLMTILRNNGIFIILFLLISILIGCLVRRKARFVRLTVVLALICVLYAGYQSRLLPRLGVKHEFNVDVFSVPLQQTARFVKNHPDDVTEQERRELNDVLPYRDLSEEYRADNADPVKDSWKGKDSRDTRLKFVRVWSSLGRRHPGTYLDAWLGTNTGFFYPDVRSDVIDTMSGIYTIHWEDTRVSFTSPENLRGAKSSLKAYVRILESMPFVFPLVNTAMQIYFCLALFFHAAYKKSGKLLLLMMIPVSVIPVCLAGPTFVHNGYRYAMPIVFTTIFLGGLVVAREDSTAASK